MPLVIFFKVYYGFTWSWEHEGLVPCWAFGVLAVLHLSQTGHS